MKHILHVEDNAADAFMVEEMILPEIKDVEIHRVADGELGMDFLHKRKKFSDAPTPNMILLDVNLPRMDGFSMMEEMKKNSAHCDIPVVILTTSSSPLDREKAISLGAKEYVIKPHKIGQWPDAVAKIRHSSDMFAD